MPNRKLVPSSYKKLVTDIASLYEGARRALVEAYWEIGQYIVRVEQEGAIRAAYGTGLLTRLSEDLTRRLGPGFSVRQLTDMRRFYLSNKNSRPAAELGWTQHIELLKVSDVNKRKAFERKAIRESLKRDDLRELVQAELVRGQVAENLALGAEGFLEPIELLTPVRGTLFTYRILDPKTVQPKEEGLLLVDLGFSCYRDLGAVTSKTFKPFDIIESVKVADDEYRLQKSTKPETELFTYKATVEKVVDGDTLRVIVDLGFNTRARQYLRLRGIDCPEMDTEEGKKAADFVRLRIRAASEIVLTSSKSDKYDRYLADVYFADSDGQEKHINNLLLENRLAVRMGS